MGHSWCPVQNGGASPVLCHSGSGRVCDEEHFMHCVEGWGEATTEKITVNTAVENKHCGNKAGPVKPGLEFSSQGFCCH
ncbi:hypothetical protein QQF64_015062 [Cirrhinus molitorella]|uniref:Uncharacterized protein n=1 Tax=Cirrhinus molitorella TaxID=172907 RepID=A0ABR3NUC5_9TELE